MEFSVFMHINRKLLMISFYIHKTSIHAKDSNVTLITQTFGKHFAHEKCIWKCAKEKRWENWTAPIDSNVWLYDWERIHIQLNKSKAKRNMRWAVSSSASNLALYGILVCRKKKKPLHNDWTEWFLCGISEEFNRKDCVEPNDSV